MRERRKPSGETQFGVTGLPPMLTVVAFENGAADEYKDRRAMRMRWVAPESVMAQVGEEEEGFRAIAMREDSARGEERTADAFIHEDTGVASIVPLLIVASAPTVVTSSVFKCRMLMAVDHEERKLPADVGSSRRTSYARGNAVDMRATGMLMANEGG